ncbi:hypothetical protein KM043_010131 [Ampulex compressa]|nr:hypothetical protein KM043_010131 [Ampulex compressa]
MALKEYLTFNALITTLIGISAGLTWKPDIRRYESYNLERGPVFYEAYYPEANEDPRNDYQEKRYFDRGAILERTYQIPTDRFSYPQDGQRAEGPSSRAGEFRYTGIYSEEDVGASMEEADRAFSSEYDSKGTFEGPRGGDSSPRGSLEDRFPNDLGESPRMDVEEISNLARRAISRDLENWSALENYLGRAKHQDQRFRGSRSPDIVIENPRSVQSLAAPASVKVDYDVGLLRSMNRLRPMMQEKEPRDFRRSTTAILPNRKMADFVQPVPYPNLRLRPIEKSVDQKLARGMDAPNSRSNIQDPVRETMVNGQLAENIFEPRPQVINYVFSRDPDKKSRSVESKSVTAVKEEPKATTLRSYGDNLIREEMKQAEEDKDVQVTSIVVSEVPRHKTRHHHGEWPKRDYPRHR